MCAYLVLDKVADAETSGYLCLAFTLHAHGSDRLALIIFPSCRINVIPAQFYSIICHHSPTRTRTHTGRPQVLVF